MTNNFAFLLGRLLKFIYDIVGNYGVSIILFTIVIKTILLPLGLAQIKSSKQMQEIQPKMNEIKKKYPNNKEKQNELTMKLYQEHKVNPLAGCLPLLIQMPILFGLFKALREPVKFVFKSQELFTKVDQSFLWVKDLGVPDTIMVGAISLPFILPILSAITTYIQTSMMNPKTNKQEKQDKKGKQIKDPAQSTMSTMTYMMPLMMLYFGTTLPAGLVLYWVMGNIYQIIQQRIINNPTKKEVATR